MHDPWRRARRELSTRDPRLAHLIQLVHPLSYVIPDPRPLSELAVGTVVSQLLSTTAARAVKTRLLEAHGSIDGVMNWARATPHDAPHAHGLSRSKRRAIAAWAEHVAEQGDPSVRWKALSTQELLAEVMALRGFGRWSAEIVAIFGFGHVDVWPEGDAGVQRVMRQLFPRMQPPRRAALVAGHASYAALCCWTVINRGLEGELTREKRDERRETRAERGETGDS